MYLQICWICQKGLLSDQSALLTRPESDTDAFHAQWYFAIKAGDFTALYTRGTSLFSV